MIPFMAMDQHIAWKTLLIQDIAIGKLQMCSFEISVAPVQLASNQSPDQVILFSVSMHSNMGESSKFPKS